MPMANMTTKMMPNTKSASIAFKIAWERQSFNSPVLASRDDVFCKNLCHQKENV